MDHLLLLLFVVGAFAWGLAGYLNARAQITFAEQVDKMLTHYQMLEQSYDSLAHSAKPLLRRMELIEKYEPFILMLEYKRTRKVAFFFRFLVPAVILGPLIHLIARKPSA